MTLCATVLATVLVNGGVGLNPGPVGNVVHVLCSACNKNLKSGTLCDSCGSWYHNSCGNVKFQVAESGKWSCERCRTESLPVLEEKLRDAQFQIELKRINKALEEVPQESVLGSLLFLAYLNDIGKNIESNIRLFADDCDL
jgi:predicted amidophosphoribosyltransferase